MKIAVVEGDGIGREVIPVALRVLKEFLPDADYFPVEVGYDKWERTGYACTGNEIDALKSADIILFGAVTTPPDPDYRSIVLQIRHELDLYANVRPVHGDNFDIVIVRENTEGMYSGIEWTESDRACTVRVITKKGCTRIAQFACQLTKQRKHLTIGNKANILKSDSLFRDTCLKEAAAAGIMCSTQYIDALALDILMKPENYDVIVTTNIFGDILSDVSAYLVGGLGLIPSANIGSRYALFEPVHGSGPDIAGQNIANPIAAVRSTALLLDHVRMQNEAKMIRDAVLNTISKGFTTPDMGGKCSTDQAGKKITDELKAIRRTA
ncbi:MAG: isocitrate/isopropylmalate dehydrogenase family protein [Euryarchaeota archaeon]|nr:isocitrate/isopropylmalate dehydrogenase family protein [Euryarchaeota archaeon]